MRKQSVSISLRLIPCLFNGLSLIKQIIRKRNKQNLWRFDQAFNELIVSYRKQFFVITVYLLTFTHTVQKICCSLFYYQMKRGNNNDSGSCGEIHDATWVCLPMKLLNGLCVDPLKASSVFVFSIWVCLSFEWLISFSPEDGKRQFRKKRGRNRKHRKILKC